MQESMMVVTRRLQDMAKKIANVNTLVDLDGFAQVVPLAMDDLLREIKPSFAAYL